ncbi:antitoxin [Spongisporangium articulatum]|uniref:Antitoxin n=1 Tax=Spongisporangium articulatum TaxID=3362603 RepID=A0ABW8AJY3_9ACTN
MGIFDEVKKKATEFAEKNPDKVEKISDAVIEKVGDAADTATKHKYSDQIAKAEAKADDSIGIEKA